MYVLIPTYIRMYMEYVHIRVVVVFIMNPRRACARGYGYTVETSFFFRGNKSTIGEQSWSPSLKPILVGYGYTVETRFFFSGKTNLLWGNNPGPPLSNQFLTCVYYVGEGSASVKALPVTCSAHSPCSDTPIVHS